MKTNILYIAAFASVALVGCGAGGDDQGLEYAPNMYHSVPYEPLSQIVDKDNGEAAQWFSDTEDGHGEYYNSNELNPYRMTMRVPPANTVPRNKSGMLPYRLGKDSLEMAAATLKNPLDSLDQQAVLADGKLLYDRFCEHCHGGAGQGDGLLAVENAEGNIPFPGIANLTGEALKNVSEGHIFHVITHGKGLMGAHGSQISPEERWKIVKYVKQLQK